MEIEGEVFVGIEEASFHQCCKPSNDLDIWKDNMFFLSEIQVVRFVRDRLCNHVNKNTLLRNLHKVYILVGKEGVDPFLKIKSNTLSKEVQENDGYGILGMIVVSKFNDTCCIEWIESYYPGKGIALMMIAEAKRALECSYALPLDVSIPKVIPYWTKWFQKTFGTKEWLNQVIKDQKIDSSLLKGYDEITWPKKQRRRK